MGDLDFVLDTLTSREVAEKLKSVGRPDWRASLKTAGLDAERSPLATRGAAPTRAAAPIAKTLPEDEMKKKGKVVVDAEHTNEAIEKARSLKPIAEKVNSCKRCLLYTTATNGVPGEGDSKAQVVIVGEAPGANEDETGLPFVGAAGGLLTKILESVNLSREEVFITNVVKHRPPGNRNPTPDEVEACSPYLIRQLELIKPKVIIAFGNFAAQTLLGTKDGIGKLRGTVHTYHGTPLVVTYHPAALLRNPNWKRPTWEDVKLARRVLDNAQGA
ncbi:MAG: uracil-DNA glycosylase [Gemmatimonadaceae bacterium]|nr:uracil-DNA glycosylase [Gemmatimonadaceae bacterium]